MKVLILAGGLGSRLSEETTLRPKPMAAIGAAQIEKLPEFCEKRKTNFHEWTRT